MVPIGSRHTRWTTLLSYCIYAVLFGCMPYDSGAQIRHANGCAIPERRNLHVAHPIAIARSLTAQFTRPLTFQFAIPQGRLTPVVTDSIAPTEAVTRLVYQQGTNKALLVSLKDLVGRVRIDTPRAALSYLRLRTSPATFYMFRDSNQPDEVEVISTSGITPDFTFGDKDEVASLKTYNTGTFGIVNADLARKVGVPAATVRHIADGFEIQRLLLAYFPLKKASQKYVVNEVVEQVGTDGRWKVVRRTPYKPAKRWKIEWYWPSFE